MKIRNILLSLIALWLSVPVFVLAQKPQVEEITVVGNFNPSVGDANKITRNPVLDDTTISMPPLQYSIISRPLFIQFPVYTIDPQKVKPEPDPAYQRNYLRAGFGSLMSPYAEFFAAKPNSKRTAFGVHFRHFSTLSDIKDYSKSTTSENQLSIFGKHTGEVLAWNADAAFRRNMLHYYGFQPGLLADSLIPPTDSTRQVYTQFKFQAGLRNASGNRSDVNYGANFRGGWYGNRFHSHELNAGFDAWINYQTDALSTRKNDHLGLNLALDYWDNSFKNLPSGSAALFSLKPYFHTEIEEYEILLGLNTSIAYDSTGTRVYLFPDIKGGLTIIKEILKLYAGIRGEVNRNGLEAITSVNPFTAPEFLTNFRKNSFEFYGGINTSLGRHLGFNASMSYSSFKNQAFFINDTLSYPLYNRFAVLYDSGTVLKARGEISYHRRESIHLTLGAEFTSYNLENEIKPWHTPELTAFATARIVALDKIILKGSFEFRGARYARIFEKRPDGSWYEPEPVRLKPFADLSLGLEYRINRNFSAFADFNNLTGGKYQYWHRFPVYGFNFLGGITYSF
ncbi:MAG: hypothetical protein HPY80_02005 [Bacteroidales bacterium]|jgi:hypothetical protein|nr:hypothetical protein [Bacteroidales bacterium]NPV35424.1 hypothetical protein [Bacteroidales bacterium]